MRLLWQRVGFWTLLPVAAAQGLALRARATRLPGAPGNRSGLVGTGRPFRLLAVGDSIIDGVGVSHMNAALPACFARALAGQLERSVHWRAEGRSGRDIEELISVAQDLDVEDPPDLVLISIGVNDVTGLSSTRHWRKSLQRLLDLLLRRWPAAKLLFAGLPPMGQFPLPPQPLRFMLGRRAGELDRVAAQTVGGHARSFHVPTRIDPESHGFCEDGFHPSEESCSLWAEALAEDIAPRLAPASLQRSNPGKPQREPA